MILLKNQAFPENTSSFTPLKEIYFSWRNRISVKYTQSVRNYAIIGTSAMKPR